MDALVGVERGDYEHRQDSIGNRIRGQHVQPDYLVAGLPIPRLQEGRTQHHVLHREDWQVNTSPTNEPKTAEQIASKWFDSFGFKFATERGKQVGVDLMADLLKSYAQQEGRELVEALEDIKYHADNPFNSKNGGKDSKWLNYCQYVADKAIRAWKARNQ